MKQNLETIEMEGIGKTNQSPNKQGNQLLRWFFTFNNYQKSDIPILESKFNEICSKYVFQEEIGEKTKTPHLQGSIVLKKKMRWTEFNLPKEIHWEKTRNEDQADLYCKKIYTNNGNVFSKGFPKPIITIKKEQFYEWQNEIYNLYETEPDGRHLYWYWEPIGKSGKSAFCKYMAVHCKVIVIQGGRVGDIMNIIYNLNMDEIKMIIIDIPRCHNNKVSYVSIECILNGMITNGKYETGTKTFNAPHVVVFSNYKPDLEDTLSLDRFIIKRIFRPSDEDTNQSINKQVFSQDAGDGVNSDE